MDDDTKAELLFSLFDSHYLPFQAKRHVLFELCKMVGLGFDSKTLEEIESFFSIPAKQKKLLMQLKVCHLCNIQIDEVKQLSRTTTPDTRKIRRAYMKHMDECPYLEVLDLYGGHPVD